VAIDAKAGLGTEVRQRLDFADFGRNAIQTAKQILIQRVREAERERTYAEFSGRVGQIESGIVQQISHGDIILNLGRTEAAIPFKEQIRRERYRQGDTVRGYIYEILKVSRGPQILLSRTHPEFLKKLFAIEVPEIGEGIVQIHSVAREPGERAKIAVSSRDERVDPVGACVGVKGSRVQAIVRELSGERIDIVPWSDAPELFIGRALSPATVTRVIVDRRRKHAMVLVGEDQLSLAIGKSGQNTRLAVQLTGWGLDIITEAEYQKRRAQVEANQQAFRKIPGVSELIGLSLATSGFRSIGEIAESPISLLQTVPGLEEEAMANRLKQAAAAFLTEHGEEGESADKRGADTAGEQKATTDAVPSPASGEGLALEKDGVALPASGDRPATEQGEALPGAGEKESGETASRSPEAC
jgi:transcription termination/antitermination protein NusA